MPQKKLNLTDECFKKNYEAQPDKTALIIARSVDDYDTYTYAQLYDSILRIASALEDYNLPKKTPFVIRSITNIDFLLLFFAAIKAGLSPISTLTELKISEINFIINNSGAKLFYQSDTVAIQKNKITKGVEIITESQLQKMKTHPIKNKFKETNANDRAFLIYTSGSTSAPKGVQHAHRLVLAREPIRKHLLDIQLDDVILPTGNPCWSYAMGSGFIDPFYTGATSVMLLNSNEDVNPETWFKLIQKFKVTIFSSSPAFYKKIEKSVQIQNYKLPSLRHAISAGEALPDVINANWQKHLNIQIHQALGCSEYNTFIYTGPKIPIRKGAIGIIQPGRDVRIISAKDHKCTKKLKPEEIGLLAINKHDPAFMIGYLNRPDEDKTCYRGDYFLTGDLVYADKDGYIYYYGRADTVLNVSGGHRVSAVEIENILLRIPEVENIACCISKTKTEDDALTALIQLSNKNKADLDKIKQAIFDFAKENLSPNKQPHKIVFVKEFPLTSNGKIIRKNLGDLIPAPPQSLRGTK